MARREGQTFSEIASDHFGDEKQIRQAHHLWTKRTATDEAAPAGMVPVQEWRSSDSGTVHYKAPATAAVDAAAEMLQVLENLMTDFNAHVARNPVRLAPPVEVVTAADPTLAVVCIMDPHLGMLAWEPETGQPSTDLGTAVDAYTKVSDQIVALSRVYPVERYLAIVGNDLLHANQYDSKTKTATTVAGTPQDMDGRLSKVFTRAVRVVVASVDAMRSTGKRVDVQMVPGNHDAHMVYALGEVLSAWYRGDDAVSVINSPNPRAFYGFGRNTFMLYHGELNKKKGLPHLVMATECPAQLWVDSEGGCREILTGHFHKRETTTFLTDINEDRAITLRSLPGLTGTDSWHSAQGYLHRRAATLLVYKKSGGLLALHEVTP